MADKDVTTYLYGGLRKLVYKNDAHKYYVDGKLTPSVSTIIHDTLAKPNLLLWPMRLALDYIREHAGENRPLVQIINEASNIHAKKRDRSAQHGTELHSAVARYLDRPSLQSLYKILDESVYPETIKLPLIAFDLWFRSQDAKVVSIEQPVYSASRGYAGTYDFILRIAGQNILCELKSGKSSRQAPMGAYEDHFCQLGGYLQAYNEANDHQREIHDLMVISAQKNGSVRTVRLVKDLNMTLLDALDFWSSTLNTWIKRRSIRKYLLAFGKEHAII